MRIVVAQAPGGPPDVVARFVAERLRTALGVPVLVENRPGASGVIGVELASRAAADGYTLLLATLSTHPLVPHVNPHAQYDPVRGFLPVANLFRSVKALWVSSTVSASSLAEFVRLAGDRRGEIHYASGGVGSSNHVDTEIFRAAAAIDLVHVPYNGPQAALAGLAAGDAQMLIVSITAGQPHHLAGKVRPLAVFAASRSPLLPNVPTAAEQGFPSVDLSAWMGIVAPVGTPAPVIDRLQRELNAILRAEATRRWATGMGLEIVGGSPAAFGRTIADDHRRWGRLVRSLGIDPR